jgi:hypothetical protein
MKKIIGFVAVMMLVLMALAAIGWQRIDVKVEVGQGKYLIHDYLHMVNPGADMKNLELSIKVYRVDGTTELVQESYPIWKRQEKKVLPIDLGWNNRITMIEFKGTYEGGKFKQETYN